MLRQNVYYAGQDSFNRTCTMFQRSCYSFFLSTSLLFLFFLPGISGRPTTKWLWSPSAGRLVHIRSLVSFGELDDVSELGSSTEYRLDSVVAAMVCAKSTDRGLYHRYHPVSWGVKLWNHGAEPIFSFNEKGAYPSLPFPWWHYVMAIHHINAEPFKWVQTWPCVSHLWKKSGEI